MKRRKIKYEDHKEINIFVKNSILIRIKNLRTSARRPNIYIYIYIYNGITIKS